MMLQSSPHGGVSTVVRIDEARHVVSQRAEATRSNTKHNGVHSVGVKTEKRGHALAQVNAGGQLLMQSLSAAVHRASQSLASVVHLPLTHVALSGQFFLHSFLPESHASSHS